MTKRNVARVVPWILLLAALFVVQCEGGAEHAKQPCEADSECSRGLICDQNYCTQVMCTATADCPTGNVCYEGSCTAQECNALSPCTEPGMSCQRGICLAELPPGNDTVGPADGLSPLDADVPGKDVTGTPDADVAADIPSGNGGVCAPCSSDGDCADDMACSPLTSGTFCTKPCTIDADCLSGYLCYQLSSGYFCTPNSYDCSPCLQTPCPDGQTCDQAADQCVTPKAECEICAYDWDCQTGMRCVTTSALQHFCVAECGDGVCATGSHCAEKGGAGGEGVMVCMPDSPSCCGADCPTCECDDPNLPFVLPGSADCECVQCLETVHCATVGAGATCNPVDHFCEGACPQGTYPSGGQCVQCLNNAHCAAMGTDYTCDSVTHSCVNNGGDPCEMCVDPYPGCAQINGVWSCVPCSTDEHCGCTAGQGCCNATTYQCNSGPGANVECSHCTSDADCPANASFELHCDTSTGCCYDANGGCDNVQAFCKSPSECKSILELFGGGTMPELPEGGPGAAGGYCTCDAEAALMCLFGACPPGAATCYGDVSCMDFGLIMDILGGGSGTGLDIPGLCMKLAK